MASVHEHDVNEQVHLWEKEFQDSIANDNLMIVARKITKEVRGFLRKAIQIPDLYAAVLRDVSFVWDICILWRKRGDLSTFCLEATALITAEPPKLREKLPSERLSPEKLPLAGHAELLPVEKGASLLIGLNPPPAESTKAPLEGPATSLREKLPNPSLPLAPQLPNPEGGTTAKPDKGKRVVKPLVTYGKSTRKGLSEGTPPPTVHPITPPPQPSAPPEEHAEQASPDASGAMEVDEPKTQTLSTKDLRKTGPALSGRYFVVPCNSCQANRNRVCREVSGNLSACFYCRRSKHMCIFPPGPNKAIMPSSPLGPPDPPRTRGANAAPSKPKPSEKPAAGDSIDATIQIDSNDKGPIKASSLRLLRSATAKAQRKINEQLEEDSEDGDREAAQEINDAPAPPQQQPVRPRVGETPPHDFTFETPTEDRAVSTAQVGDIEDRLRRLEARMVAAEAIVSLLYTFSMNVPVEEMQERMWEQMLRRREQRRTKDTEFEMSAINPVPAPPGAASSSKPSAKASSQATAAPKPDIESAIIINRSKPAPPTTGPIIPRTSSSTAAPPVEVDGTVSRKRKGLAPTSGDRKRKRVV